MVKVRNKLFILWYILTLFNAFPGKYFGKDGRKYEGEYKLGKKHGKGKI